MGTCGTEILNLLIEIFLCLAVSFVLTFCALFKNARLGRERVGSLKLAFVGLDFYGLTTRWIVLLLFIAIKLKTMSTV